MHPFFLLNRYFNKNVRRKMKKFEFGLLLLAVVLLTAGCKEPKKPTVEDLILQTDMELSKQDTVEVQQMADAYMELLKNKQYDEALKMVYYVDTLQDIIPIPEENKKTMKMMLKRFPVLSYHCDGIVFHKEMDSQIKYTIEFFKKEPGDDRPNTTAMYLKPMRKDGKWYLTIYDTASHHAPPSEIQ